MCLRRANEACRWWPRPVLLVALLGLIAIALPMTDLRLGLPGDGMAATNTTQRQAYDLISAGFGPGLNGPLTVVVTSKDAANAGSAATRTAATIKAPPDVAEDRWDVPGGRWHTVMARPHSAANEASSVFHALVR
jgi:RND superfamily putative drug exporter